MIQLDERLGAIENMIGPCRRVVDIGSNHGFLPVHMLQTGRCEWALLCDISSDALRRARQAVAQEGVGETAELRVTDGLQGVDLEAGDVVSVCGMGARTIAHILNKKVECPVVMQPNVELKFLRRHLEQIGMRIVHEDVARAGGRFYVILRAEPGEDAPLSDYEAHIGRALLRDRPPLLEEYLLWRQGVAGRALQGMKIGRDAEKLEMARQDAEDVERALREVRR